MGAMPLHMTKIAFTCDDVADLRRWMADCALPTSEHGGEARLTTRYVPKRQAEMVSPDGDRSKNGSLFWIKGGVFIGRSPLLGFEQKADGRWWIRLEPRVIGVMPQARRAHQGWRYLAEEDAPADLAGDGAEEAMPGRLASDLARLGLV